MPATKKHNARPTFEIEFADGITREVHPLTIKQLRKFVVALDKIQETADATKMTDEDIDNMLDTAIVILTKVDPELCSDRDALEEAVDLVVFGHLMNVALGTASPEE